MLPGGDAQYPFPKSIPSPSTSYQNKTGVPTLPGGDAQYPCPKSIPSPSTSLPKLNWSTNITSYHSPFYQHTKKHKLLNFPNFRCHFQAASVFTFKCFKKFYGVTTGFFFFFFFFCIIGYSRGPQLNDQKFHIVPNMPKFPFILFVFERL